MSPRVSPTLALALGLLPFGCLTIPGTTPRATPAQDAAAKDAPADTSRDLPLDFVPTKDATGDRAGLSDAPLVCEGDDGGEPCCGIFGFEDGTTAGFASSCCADAFSAPENLLLASLSGEGGCGDRGLRLDASFLLAEAAGCDTMPFGAGCSSQIGEISALLPGAPETFDLRGRQLTGRLWLPKDVDVATFTPVVRAFAVSAAGIVYGAPFAVPDQGWQSFACPFANPQDPTLQTVSRWGVQLVLRPVAIPDHRWSGPVWFDALGWRASPPAVP